MDLDEALRQFDRVETNLERLDAVVSQMDDLVPDGISFAGSSPEGLAYQDLCRDYAALEEALPAIDGFRIEATPLGLDEIAQWRTRPTLVRFSR